MEKSRKEIQKVLDAVAMEGAYTTGHVLIIEQIINHEIAEIQEGMKFLLGIESCDCPH